MQKRLLTIQDFSCLGRCSLTVAQPTISACGIECVAIPTAILSNHTQYESWTFRDLSDDIENIVLKWTNYNHSFDMIYTGYLTDAQIEQVIKVIKSLKNDNTLVYVDPAMADNGVLYKGFTEEHIFKMIELAKIANYVKPNVTEACLMTGEEYKHGINPLSYYENLVLKMAKLGFKNIILTGCVTKENSISILVKEENNLEIKIFDFKYIDAYLHGTGDLFSACLSSLITKGYRIEESIEIAHKYVVKSIEYTLNDGIDGLLYGPEFEKAIPYLVSLMN